MRIAPFAFLTSLTLAAALSSGCVAQEKYDGVAARMKERDAACVAAEKKAADAQRQAELANARAQASEKEVLLLKTQLEGRDIARSQRSPGETTVAAGSPRASEHDEHDEHGAPADVGLPINSDTGGIILDGGVLFPPGSATLRPQAEPVLAKVAEAVNRPGTDDLLVRIEGHTDDQPITRSKFRDNWDLSGERAQAVLVWLEGHGVASDRLSFAGFGSSRPLAISGKDARVQNRRVEVVLLKRR